MFTVMTHAVQINLIQRINSALNNFALNKWLFHQNGFIRTSLSATVTRVSNSVEENVCVCVCVFFFLHRQGSPSRWIQSFVVQHDRLNMSIAMHSARSKHLIKVVSKNAQFYF